MVDLDVIYQSAGSNQLVLDGSMIGLETDKSFIAIPIKRAETSEEIRLGSVVKIGVRKAHLGDE